MDRMGWTDAYTRNPLVLKTAKLSLFVQLAFVGITGASLFVTVPKGHDLLTSIVILETASQVIEFTYYTASIYVFGRIATWTRYIDWFLSTPIMLISTMAFLAYLDVDGKPRPTHMSHLFDDDHAVPTAAVLGFNFLMLCFGLLTETRYIDSRYGLTLGMVAFLGSFYVMFASYVRRPNPVSIVLFMFVYVVWGLYGVAATLSNVSKNVCYNFLDVVSKNFYGAFLLAYVVAISQ